MVECKQVGVVVSTYYGLGMCTETQQQGLKGNAAFFETSKKLTKIGVSWGM